MTQIDPVCALEVSALGEEILDTALDRHTRQVGEDESETFIHCKLCGEWEGHADTCLIPALQQWLNAPP